MRISDWIADVCSSDLNKDVIHVEADTGVAAGASRGQSANAELPTRAIAVVERHTRKKRTDVSEISDSKFLQPVSAEHRYVHRHITCRSQERRVGKGWVSRFRITSEAVH